MRAVTLQAIRLLAIALALAMAIGHTLLPPKRESLLPSANNLYSLYADDAWGGKTTASWIDRANHHWRCRVVRSEFHPVCGLAISFPDAPNRTLDFSRYDALSIRLNYQGEAGKIRIYLRNHNPEYSDMGDVDSLKFIAVTLRVSEFSEQETVIHLTEFAVADWWLEERDVPRSLSLPERDGIAVLGIDFPPPLIFGEHEIQLLHIELIGPWISTEQLYFWIILIAATALITEAAHRLTFVYRHVKTGAAHLQAYSAQARVLREHTEKYKNLAVQDPTTGILNRNGLAKRIDTLFEGDNKNTRHSGNIAIILFDLDRFKRINDRRGYETGDRILHNIARLVQINIRNEDVLARWGGEEFILISPRTTQEAAYSLAEKIRSLIGTQNFDTQTPLYITASFGVAMAAPAEAFEDAFKRADEALYNAKELGRNCTAIAETKPL